MPLFRINRYVVFFIHVPKTGGRSIERYLSRHGPMCLFSHKEPRWGLSSPQHMHAQIYNALVRSAFYDYAFMVTRDPVNRLISQYKMRRQARVRRVTRLGIELDFPPFDEWVRSTLQKYSDDPYIHDNHIRPQHEFHSSGVEVFKFEEGLEKVRAKLHKLLEIGPENETPMRHVGMSSDAPISLTDETLSLIQDFYIEDYKRFGYPLRARGTVSAAVAC